MTDTEYDLLDELYFIKSIDEMENIFQASKLDMKSEIWNLVEKKWVKILDDKDNELVLTKESYLENCKLLRFNVTKKGLLAHNQI